MTPMQYKEAERLANNYHKNRLIDLKRARFHYHEAMKELLTGKRSAFAKQPRDKTKKYADITTWGFPPR